jgi:drug/metabolite transporter (DMT)-like permease
LIYGEKLTREKVIGGFVILSGTIAVLYNGSFQLNLGDLLIILGTFFYPFGNHYAKAALQEVRPSVILFLRSLVGGLALLSLSFLFEHPDREVFRDIQRNSLWLILLAMGGLGMAKLLWFEGLKRLDVSKATAIVIAGPAFSFLYAVILLKEVPTIYQFAGFFIILVGLYLLTRQKAGGVVEVT